jgi:hypothetical protein
MSTLQQQITDKFLASLAAEKSVTPEMLDALKLLLASGKKIKADDIVAVFTTPSGGTVT